MPDLPIPGMGNGIGEGKFVNNLTAYVTDYSAHIHNEVDTPRGVASNVSY